MNLFTTVINKFLEHLKAINRSEETLIGYGKDLESFSRYLQRKYNGVVYLEDITVDDIESFLSYLNEQGQAPASRSRKLYTLRSFFNYACKKEYVNRNIASSVEHITLPQKERIYLSEEEVQQLVSVIGHDLIRLVVQMLYLTGLRISECLNLTLQTVDLEQKVIRVVAGKGNKDRLIPISNKLLPLLQAYERNGRPVTDSELFFCTKKTGKLSDVYVNRVLADAVKTLKWKKKVTAHILRHSFASQLVKKDVNLVQIQKLLGHSSLKVTSIYTHTNLEQLSDAVNCL